MTDVKQAVRLAQQAARQRQHEYDLDREQREVEARRYAAARATFLEHCRPATVEDYAAWLTSYLDSDGTITHSYDYRMPKFWVLVSRPSAIPSLYGAFSMQVIVPAGLLSPRDVPNTFHGGCGHSTFYFHGRLPVVVGGSVPLYTDVADKIMREVSQ